MRPRLLDLFCGAGGAAMGYSRAGFEVVGVDIKPQPNYPFEFWQGDAMELLRADDGPFWIAGAFGVIHASPPCQRWTAYARARHGDRALPGYPNLIAPVRQLLRAANVPYVIENIPGAPLEGPIQLCGSSFGLDVRRHRLFEASVPLMALPCDHAWQRPRFPAATNREPNSRSTVEIGVWRIPLDVQQRAMGIDWMELDELSEAIPPAYTEHIGHYLMAEVKARQAA